MHVWCTNTTYHGKHDARYISGSLYLCWFWIGNAKEACHSFLLHLYNFHVLVLADRSSKPSKASRFVSSATIPRDPISLHIPQTSK